MRISRHGPIPEHYEQAFMSAAPRAGLWILGGVLALAGILSGSLAGTPLVRYILSPLASTSGAVLVLIAWRLSRFEVLVTRTALRAGLPPFPRWAPRDTIGSTAVRPATGWRRLYAAEELLVTFDDDPDSPPMAIPSAAPQELARELGA